jgi:hypothetical protein
LQKSKAKSSPYNRDYIGRPTLKNFLHSKGFVVPVEGEGKIAGGKWMFYVLEYL